MGFSQKHSNANKVKNCLLVVCRFSLFSCFLSLVACRFAYANALTITNATLTGQNGTEKTIQIKFDVRWENSWRNNTNRDAVWVFAKYSTDSGVTWNHCTLKTAGSNPTGTSQGSGTGLTLIVPSDKMGAFLERSAVGHGTTNTTGIELVWDWQASGLSANTQVRVKVFGVEMVYVTQGPFYAGDGETASIAGQFENATSGMPKQVASESQLTLGGNVAGSMGNNNAAGMLTADDFGDATSKTLPANFPKGSSPYYIMKYEISQGQYIDFLNTLTRVQQNHRVNSNITGDAPVGGKVYVMAADSSAMNRNTIRCPDSGNGTTSPITFTSSYGLGGSRRDRACNYLCWMDLAAYADWAGLRPMSELEYEKACRGPNAALSGEYAWGNAETVYAAAISGTEDGTETIATIGANSCGDSQVFSGGDDGTGPLRTGIFATANSSRVEAGAGYYGGMELSGNVYELTVSVGSSAGRAFSASHGDGILTSVSGYEGNATNTDWPGIDGTAVRGITGALGSGYRGGSWALIESVSDRSGANTGIFTRNLEAGGRCARTA